jgi:PhnB protein
MDKRSQMDQLELALQAMLAGPNSVPVDPELAPLLRIAQSLRDLPREGFKARLRSELERKALMASSAETPARVSPVPTGYHTITPYIVVQDVPWMIQFMKDVFGAEEAFRTVGSAGGYHVEMKVGDSMIMIGGGAPELAWRGENQPVALHVYVEDTDGAYERAMQAGVESTGQPVDQPYGERGAGVKDQFGNHWYIATHKGQRYIPEGLFNVNPYLHPRRAEPLISFLKQAFGAEEIAKYASPEGAILHAQVRIGDSVLEMGEAQGPYQPMASMFYMYVPDVDTMYRQALAAGATSISPPTDQSYGDRSAGVKDAFGHTWYIATHVRDVG